MKRPIYQKIAKLIESNQIQTLTLDIFDTVLMRRVWPEDRQFLVVADRWLPHFQSIISQDITRDKLYSWRQYARDELFRAHYELSNEGTDTDQEFDVSTAVWFGHLIDLLADVHQAHLTPSKRKRLLEVMMAIEMETEKEYLKPNEHLLSAIRLVKQEYPELKVYFLSDMYLSSQEVMELLSHFDIEVFDGGVSSVTAQSSKHSGRIYHALHNTPLLSEEFSIFDNLHIGDSLHSDYKMAQQSGSLAINYHPYRFRRLRTKFGSLRLAMVRRNMRQRDLKRLREVVKSDTRSPRQVWRSFGGLFSQPLYAFLLHIGTLARQRPETKFMMVSSEAVLFNQLGKKLFPGLFSSKNIIVAERLNRRMMLRALVWFLAESQDSKFNAEVIFQTICLGEVEGSRREIYDFFFGKSFPSSELVLNRRSEKEFLAGFLDDIRTADTRYTKHLKAAYDYVSKFLPTDDSPTVVVDVGWGGTVQVLFSQFAKLHGLKQEVEGLYLGVHPFHRFQIKTPRAVGYLLPNVHLESRGLWNAIIWEYAYTNKPQFPEDISRLAQVSHGFDEGAELFRRIETNPKAYFDKTIRSSIKRLISRPTRYEVQTIGSIRFDAGFVDEGEFSIVNLNLPQGRVWLDLLRRPKQTLRQTAFVQNAWIGGYIKYYRMYGVRLALRVVGFFRRKRYV